MSLDAKSLRKIRNKLAMVNKKAQWAMTKTKEPKVEVDDLYESLSSIIRSTRQAQSVLDNFRKT